MKEETALNGDEDYCKCNDDDDDLWNE